MKNFSVLDPDWTAEEETQLLNLLLQRGQGNWEDIARAMQGAKTAEQCQEHFQVSNRNLLRTTNSRLNVGLKQTPYRGSTSRTPAASCWTYGARLPLRRVATARCRTRPPRTFRPDRRRGRRRTATSADIAPPGQTSTSSHRRGEARPKQTWPGSTVMTWKGVSDFWYRYLYKYCTYAVLYVNLFLSVV